MTPKVFFKFVEIQTKIASLFPFLFALLFTLHRYGSINAKNSLLMFFSLLLFDMTTTGINNLMDYRKSGDPDYRNRVNIVGAAGIGERQAALHILLMLATATILGILLVFSSGPLVLFLGALSFFVGIFYTFGPIPISRMPLGEILSGFFMGFVILLISVYIHHTSLVTMSLDGLTLFLTADLGELCLLLLISLPFIFSIANLMLANNICDLDQDIRHDRYLLPYYLGIEKSLLLYRLAYYAAYLAILAGVIARTLPYLSLATLFSLLPIEKNIRIFCREQDKEKTFVTAVKNLTIISLSYIAPLALSVLIGFWNGRV